MVDTGCGLGGYGCRVRAVRVVSVRRLGCIELGATEKQKTVHSKCLSDHERNLPWYDRILCCEGYNNDLLFTRTKAKLVESLSLA